ncbi:MAG: hypothetical protein D6798_17595 [Deltaproteobacteria bacterium]|nr:MAG: hypothetical protein D6798_17595 [Deltaproteobacteria bacterium]
MKVAPSRRPRATWLAAAAVGGFLAGRTFHPVPPLPDGVPTSPTYGEGQSTPAADPAATAPPRCGEDPERARLADEVTALRRRLEAAELRLETWEAPEPAGDDTASCETCAALVDRLAAVHAFEVTRVACGEPPCLVRLHAAGAPPAVLDAAAAGLVASLIAEGRDARTCAAAYPDDDEMDLAIAVAVTDPAELHPRRLDTLVRRCHRLLTRR